MYKSCIKRCLDFLLSLCAIIILSPVLLVLCILVRTKLGSPVFFHQERPGRNEKIFTLCKFRTMTDARDANGELLPDSVRLTKFGKFLRATSLDELPELFNILKGDMSIIGPRPLPTYEQAACNEYQQQRLLVKPGLSCYTALDKKSEEDFDYWIELDMKYIRERSFLTDIKIIFRTIGVVFKHNNY